MIDSERRPLTFAEIANKKYLCNGDWLNEISDGQDHLIDAIRYVMTVDILRG